MANLSPLGIALSMQGPNDPASRPNIAPTDVVGAYKLATDAANTQYLAKLQQQNAMWGGLAGLGGAGLLAAPRMYSSGMLPGLFGGGGGAAGTAGSVAGAAGGADALGAGAADALAPTAAADFAAPALADAGGVAGADALAAAAPAAADAASFSLADILPFLLAA